MEIQYEKTDAFTGRCSDGNPAATLYLTKEQTLTPAQMQQIATAHKGYVSEVVYCTPCDEQGIDFDLRYYSSECEVEFCGHGTIACMYSLVKRTPELRDRESVRIRTNMGCLTVYNRLNDQDAVYITAPAPVKSETTFAAQEVADALGLPMEQLDTSLPIEVINAGLRTLLVPIKTLRQEVALYPDQEKLRLYTLAHDVDIVCAFTSECEGPFSTIHSRIFAPKFGYLEDPATGSGNSALANYMLAHDLWKGEPAMVEQGAIEGRFNIVCIMTGENGEVLFGGCATTRVKGVYLL